VRRIVMAALIVVSSATSAHAQSTTQVWPEISVFTRLNDRMRFYFLATTVKESRESTEVRSARPSVPCGPGTLPNQAWNHECRA